MKKVLHCFLSAACYHHTWNWKSYLEKW